jgi:heptosyltransferase-2
MASMKIVVRAPNWIGDSILALPSLTSLKEHDPQAQIWVAAHGWVKDLFSLISWIEGVIPLPDVDSYKKMRASARTLQEQEFDVGLLLTNSFASALLFTVAKIPQRWGYKKDGRGLLLTRGVAAMDRGAPFHQVQYYLNLIAGLGITPSPPQLSIPLTQEHKNRAKSTLLSLHVDPEAPLIILNPGAFYGSAKRWLASRYAELASLLQERKGATVLIIGSAEEVVLAESIAASAAKKPVILSGKTSLPELAGITHEADLFITNDSGPLHIANALNTPVVALFGPTDPRHTGPFHAPSCVIQKQVPCWPCWYRECPFDHRCMMKISTEEVYQACQKFLE